MLDKLELDPQTLPGQNDTARWPELRARIAERFATRTRDEWAALFSDSDACVTPVLDMDECLTHPFANERGLFETHGGVTAPAPAPRFSRTPTAIRNTTLDPAADTQDALRAWGLSETAIAALREKGVIAP